MSKILLVGLGGFIGAILRYGLSGLVQNLTHSISFPYGTLVVNMTGCFLIWLPKKRRKRHHRRPGYP